MRRSLVALLAAAVVLAPVGASAGGGHRWHGHHRHHHGHHGYHHRHGDDGVLVGLGVVGVILGTVLLADALSPREPYPYPARRERRAYDEGYRDGYDDGRYDERYRWRFGEEPGRPYY